MSTVREAADSAVAAAQGHDPSPRIADAAASNPRLAIGIRVAYVASWLAMVGSAVLYSFKSPTHGNPNTIWDQNSAHHTPFSLNSIITTIYADIGFVLQLMFIYLHFTSNRSLSSPTFRISPYLALSNLFFFAQIMLWVHGLFWPALLIAVLNFLLLLFTYLTTPFASSALPLPAHAGALTMPLVMAFVSVYWVGAVAVDAHSLAARIVANVFIWGWAAFAGFFLLAFRDWTVGLSVSVLTASLGVAQFLTHVVALQWIFAFSIMGLVFLASVGVIVKNPQGPAGHTAPAIAPTDDREREPLLGRE